MVPRSPSICIISQDAITLEYIHTERARERESEREGERERGGRERERVQICTAEKFLLVKILLEEVCFKASFEGRPF